MLTDCWLYLDHLLNKKLLVKPGESKEQQASLEAECKKLMGALRYLYRNRSSVCKFGKLSYLVIGRHPFLIIFPKGGFLGLFWV